MSGHHAVTVVAVAEGKYVTCLLCCATQYELYLVCIHAQERHWPLTTGRRIWLKLVSSVRRICSIPSSMPVTPSAEVHTHTHTHLHTPFLTQSLTGQTFRPSSELKTAV